MGGWTGCTHVSVWGQDNDLDIYPETMEEQALKPVAEAWWRPAWLRLVFVRLKARRVIGLGGENEKIGRQDKRSQLQSEGFGSFYPKFWEIQRALKALNGWDWCLSAPKMLVSLWPKVSELEVSYLVLFQAWLLHCWRVSPGVRLQLGWLRVMRQHWTAAMEQATRGLEGKDGAVGGRVWEMRVQDIAGSWHADLARFLPWRISQEAGFPFALLVEEETWLQRSCRARRASGRLVAGGALHAEGSQDVDGSISWCWWFWLGYCGFMGSPDPGPLCLLGRYDRRPVEVPRVEPNPMVERAFVIQFGASRGSWKDSRYRACWSRGHALVWVGPGLNAGG